MVLVSAYLIKKYSYRLLFLNFTGIFAIGTIMGALAPNFYDFGCRSIGSGVIMPLVNVMAMRYADPGHQGRVMGMVDLAFNFSPIIGPSVAGLILADFNVYYINFCSFIYHNATFGHWRSTTI
ncbi:MFS transporter [Limosilactobacillus mucosae]